MKNNFAIFLFLVASQLQSYSQTKVDSTGLHHKTDFKATQLIIPAALITIGALGVNSGWFKPINQNIRDEVVPIEHDKFHADDYMQYLPVISVYGLSLAGAKAKHSYYERTLITATSYLAMGIMVNTVKLTVSEQRPNSSATNSFPSGHSATAFMGAELVRKEYWDSSPAYGIGAYMIACGVGFLRIYNDRHWANDIIAGAGFGILSAQIGYWLLPLNKWIFHIIGKRKTTITALPFYNGTQLGAACTIRL